MSYIDEFGLFVELDHNGLALPGVKPLREEPAVRQKNPCPLCGEGLFDNRPHKANPRAPDWLCDKTCGFVMWPGQTNKEKAAAAWLKKKERETLR